MGGSAIFRYRVAAPCIIAIKWYSMVQEKMMLQQSHRFKPVEILAQGLYSTLSWAFPYVIMPNNSFPVHVEAQDSEKSSKYVIFLQKVQSQ
ncbi:hypothetical protein RRG08_023548 [Elysia crispata]|uniref:Uncharacterized protein n=1 Tax=Elysia crispata TaxID=231223 RepID=A0AAE1DD49_9GAST|nr:hypothetical protein RRG08_023548 [Elysia crispata]